MLNIYAVAAFWFLSALTSTIIENRLKISDALMGIIIGAHVGFLAFKTGFTDKLALDTDWMKCHRQGGYSNANYDPIFPA